MGFCFYARWPQIESELDGRGRCFFWNDGASFIIFEHNFASVAKMYKTVLCFEMSSSLFSRLYGNTQFLVKTLRELHRSKLQTIKTFLFVQLYTPKRLWFWLHKSQVKKISQCQRPRKTHHTFIPYHACSRTEPATFGSPRARDSRAGSERVDFVFKSNSTLHDHVLKRDSFSDRVHSADVGDIRQCLLFTARWSKNVE